MWEKSVGNQAFWGDLAQKFKYPSAESLRSAFKRERKNRGVSKEDNRTSQQNPVVGFFDVETLPLKVEGYLWGIRDQYVSHEMIKEPYALLGWSGKYYDDSEIFSDVMTSKEALSRNTLRITKSAFDFVNSCDIVVYHNGDEFDAKVLNAELTRNSLPPLKYRSIDTLKLIRANYYLPSYKLDYVNSYFGITRKVKNDGMPLWERCTQGDPKALKEMEIYNQGHIVSLEDLFWTIQPYCQNIPSFSIYNTESIGSCSCGGKLVKDKQHLYWYTNASKFERMRCESCGAVHRGKKNQLRKGELSNVTYRV